MTDTSLLVSVVDDDESVRESLPDLLKELGFAARTFSSAEEFLESHTALQTGCLILDIAMPGMGGPELQRELKRRGIQTRLSSLPLIRMRLCGETLSNKAQWNVCLSLSAIRPCLTR